MKVDLKYRNIETLIQKYVLLSPIGKMFRETDRGCGSCYAFITYVSPDLILRAHDDKGIPMIEVGKRGDPSSFIFLSEIYRHVKKCSRGDRHVEISEQLRFLVEEYRLVCDVLMEPQSIRRQANCRKNGKAMMDDKPGEIYRRYFKTPIDQGRSLYSKDDMQRVMTYISQANSEMEQDVARAQPIGSMIAALARFSTWAVEQHCQTEEELIQEKNPLIEALCQTLRKQLESEFRFSKSSFKPPESLDDDWRIRFSTLRLKEELGIDCPESLHQIYERLNNGSLKSLSFDISRSLLHFATQHLYRLIDRDYDTSTNTCVYSKSIKHKSDYGMQGWVFAIHAQIPDGESYLWVDSEGAVHVTAHGATFNDEDILHARLGNSFDSLFPIEPDQLSANPTLEVQQTLPEIKDLIGDHRWCVLDAECVDNPRDYEPFIASAFVGNSEGLLVLEHFSATSTNENIVLTLKLNGQDFLCNLKAHNGWVDESIISQFNEILASLNLSDKRFVLVRDPSWGQELGIAFVSRSEHKRLSECGYL